MKSNLYYRVKLFLSLTITFSLIGCSKESTYNPFDTEYDISVRQVIRNGCDTISAGCHYYNLRQQTKPSYMYYQVHSDNFYDVVSKGFIYHIDTFTIAKFDNYYKSAHRDSILDMPFSIRNLDRELEKYNYSYLDKIEEINLGMSEKSVRIINRQIDDTLALRLNLAETNIRNKYVRNVEYFAVKPK